MNPSGQPFPNQFGGAPPPSGTGGGGAREALNVPSLLLIIFGSLNVLFGLYGLVAGGMNKEQLAQFLNDPNMPQQAKDMIAMMAGAGSKVIGLLGLVISGLMVFGGVQMRNLKSYGLAMAACILGILPCTNCCCVTLPIGIWALTILMKPEIKSAFS
jgi:hypothetical protein